MPEMPDTYWDLFAGYTAVWLILAVFIIRLVREQTKLKRELEELNKV